MSEQEIDLVRLHDAPRGSRGVSTATGVASDEQLRLLMEHAVDYAIVMLSADGIVLTWNDGAERILGYAASEVVGRHFSLFYTADAIDAALPEYELEAATRHGRYSQEGWRLRNDGTTFWASAVITPLRGVDSELKGFGQVTRDLTERRTAAVAMEQLQAAQRKILETLDEGVIFFTVTRDGPVIELANPAACELLGLTQAVLRAISAHSVELPIITDGGLPMSRHDLPYEVTARTAESVHGFVWGWVHDDGRVTWVSSTSRPVLDPAGKMVAVVFSLVDITEKHTANRDLEAAYDRFAALVEHSSDVICVLDTNAVVRYASPAFHTMYGEDPTDRLGRPLTDRLHVEDQSKLLTVLSRIAERSGQVRVVECRVVQPDGTVRHVELTATNRLTDPAVTGVVINSHDITDRVEAAESLAFDATHDALTGLPNRVLLLDRLTHILDQGKRIESRCALLFIDLDHFKNINDSLGHASGDRLLIAVAARLTQALRPGDTVARLGGDEFVILAEQVDNAETARVIAERTRKAVAAPIDIDGRPVTPDCSIGIALATRTSRPEALLQQADTALYKAKARGRGGAEVYDQAMRVSAEERISTEALLRQALDNDDVVVHYQPIVALPSGTVVGSEALVRLRDHEGHLLLPARFIPVAEESGLVVPLGADVLRQACEQQAIWAADGPPAPQRVSVNLSAWQLRSPDLANQVGFELSRAGLRASALCLELTETALIQADNATRRAVMDLKDLGISLALDDFGTGWSSLTHLRHFPISVLKIDRSFIHGLGRNDSDTEVVKAIISLGLALDLGVVAEGVETARQVDLLIDLGCPHAQGFLSGRPAPA
jgi:diguanylate cyclase (GGDEF)-like protein/PAS domain S-box-containing protein